MRKWNKLLALLLAMVMALGLTATGFAAEGSAEEPVTPFEVPAEAEGAIVILHTNDVHGAIDTYAKVAALKAMYEEAGATVYLVDAGDYIQGEIEVSASRGANAIALMNLTGYDLAIPGNHEFDFGYANLVEIYKKAEFPILAANILYEDELAFEANIVFETEDDVKVGIFGLDTPESKTKTHPAKTVGVEFLSDKAMYAAAQAQVEELTAAECDYIICVGHLGIDKETAASANRSIDLLENVTGIDVLIDGHSHSTLDAIVEETNADRTVGETVITSTGTKLANIGVVTLKDGEITTENVSTAAITAPEDSPITALAQELRADIDSVYGVTVGTSAVLLNGEKAPGNRTEETNLGDLVCDALMWKATESGYEVDAAFTNGGGIRASISEGTITKKDVFNVLPFFNTLAIADVTGAQLLEILEASTYCTPDAVGGFPQVSGIEYTINVSEAFDQGEQYPDSTYFAPASIKRITIQTVGGEAFDPEATYQIATNDFLAAGGDTCYVLKDLDAEHNRSVEVFLDEALEEYITEELGGTVSDKYAEPAGRITIVGEPPAAEPEEPAPAATTFTDVKEGDWFYANVMSMYDKGVVNGFNDGSFLPNDSITWGQALKMVIAYLTGEEKAPVEGGDWASGYVAYAKENGIIDGDVDTNAVITRVEVCQVVAKALKVAASEAESKFSDTTDGYVMALAELGVIDGYTDGTFKPADPLTRAAVCKILDTLPEDLPAAEEETAEPEEAEAEAETEGEEEAEAEEEKAA